MIKLFFIILLNLNNSAIYEHEITTINKSFSGIEKQQAFEYFYQNTFLKRYNFKDISKLSKSELIDIIKIYYEITFHTQSSNIVKDYLIYFERLEKQGWAETKDYINVYGALIKSRMFKQANIFYDQYKQIDLAKLPTFIDANSNTLETEGITVFKVDLEQDNRLIKEQFSFSKNKEIIVITHPKCHFSIYAAKAIVKDAKLSSFMKKNSLWISPPDTRFSYDVLKSWQLQFPSMEVKYIEFSKDFSEFDYWGTPTFYFMENGKVLNKLIGWPKEGRVKELKSYIKKHFSTSL